jgi:hypothetical protein
MKCIVLSIVIIALSTSAYGFEEEGVYKAGSRKPIIKVELGARGGTEFKSTACPGKVFKPKYNDVGYEGKGYIIFVDEYGLTIENDKNDNKCLPEGRYLKEGK